MFGQDLMELYGVQFDIMTGLKYVMDQSEGKSLCKTAEGRHTDAVREDPFLSISDFEKKKK